MMTGIERRPMSPEAILADGCAPVIMGAKPSNLVSFDSSAAGFSVGWLLDSRAKFARSGIASYELRRTDARTLVLFYRPCMLSLCLGEPQSAALLRRCGYREGNLGALLAQLTERYRSNLLMECAGKRVLLDSLIGMLSISCRRGEKLFVIAEGDDERQACRAMVDALRGE